jgi:hypothetical protein
MGTVTSWNPLGHSRPVTGLLYLSRIKNMRNSMKKKSENFKRRHLVDPGMHEKIILKWAQ